MQDAARWYIHPLVNELLSDKLENLPRGSRRSHLNGLGLYLRYLWAGLSG